MLVTVDTEASEKPLFSSEALGLVGKSDKEINRCNIL